MKKILLWKKSFKIIYRYSARKIFKPFPFVKPIFLKKYILYFKFWDTYAGCTGFLYRYTHATVVCCTHHPSTTLEISPASFPYPPPLVCDVPLPVSMCSHCSTPTYKWEHVVFGFSVLVSVCWEWWFPASCISLQRTFTHPFLWLHSIPWCICATFSLSSLSLMGIWVGSKSLLLWIVLQ